MFKCSIGREDLLKPLGQISGVAGGSSGGSSQQPSITTNVLLEIKPVENPVADGPKYKLCMICTDNEIQSMFGDRAYLILSVALIIIAIVVFIRSYERKKPSTKDVVLLSVMISLAVVGRLVFFMVQLTSHFTQ